MEYVAAKTTMCRQCGGSYAPAIVKPEPKVRLRPEISLSVDLPIFQKLEGFWGRAHNSTIECFDCHAKQEVSSAASSTICPACSKHIDLKDYKITTSFSRQIRTHGSVHLTARGDLSSSSVVCRSAIIEGKLRGNLHCAESAIINYSGKIPGRLSASHVTVERRAEVHFFRQLQVKSIEIRGHMSGEILAESVVVIHKNGSLDGNVTAKSISVEKGGMFTGELVIGRQKLTQAELLPEEPAPVAGKRDAPTGALIARPLPAS